MWAILGIVAAASAPLEPMATTIPPSVLTGLALVGGIIIAGIIRRRAK